jgi:very-short-patch-repair endonuclease
VLGQSAKLIVSGPRDARVAAVAAQQRGRVARRQLLDVGLTVGQVGLMVRRGRMFRLHQGVYAVGHLAPVALGRETAALLAAGEGALLSHLSAGVLWDMLDDDATDEVHVLVDAARNSRRSGIRCRRSTLIEAADRRTRHGLPVTSPAHVLLDLAGEFDERRLVRAYDRGQIAGILRPRDIEELLRRTTSHPHRRRFAALLGDRPGITRSEAEQLLLGLVRDAGLPLPHVNQRLHGFEVDFHWPEAALVIEVDGFAYHSSRAAFERDHARDARLKAAGVEVLRITWRQLEREPLAVVALIAQALALALALALARARRSRAEHGER